MLWSRTLSYFKTFSYHLLSNNLFLTSPFLILAQITGNLSHHLCYLITFAFVCLSRFTRYFFFFFLVQHRRIKMEPLLYLLFYWQQNTNIINILKAFPAVHICQRQCIWEITLMNLEKFSILNRKLAVPHHKYISKCKD